MPTLEIHSVGPPPERHSNRIVAEMMKHLARQHSQLWETIEAITQDPHTRDGNPRAQRKIEARVKAAGAKHRRLEPGKRGRYRLFVNDWVGWNVAVDKRSKLMTRYLINRGLRIGNLCSKARALSNKILCTGCFVCDSSFTKPGRPTLASENTARPHTCDRHYWRRGLNPYRNYGGTRSRGLLASNSTRRNSRSVSRQKCRDDFQAT